MNLFSAFCSALTALTLFLATSFFLRNSKQSILAQSAIAAIAPVLWIQAPLNWKWATTAEVYALNALFLALLFLLLIKRSSPYSQGLLFGLSLQTHLVSALCFFPLLYAQYHISFEKRRKKRMRIWSKENQRAFFQCLATAFLVYSAGALFLFLRANSDPVLNWGDPSTLERLWYHLTAKQYQVNLFQASLQRRVELFQENLVLLNHSLPFFIWILIPFAIRNLWKSQWQSLVIGIIAAILLNLLYTASYDIAQDRDAYLLPSLLLLCVIAVTAIVRMANKISSPLLFLLPFAALILGISTRYSSMDRSQLLISSTFVHQTVTSISDNSIILTGNWQLYSPFLYKKHVEHQFPTITMIDLPLWQNRAWYVEQFQRRNPTLAQQWAPALDSFLVYLRQFERGELSSTTRIAFWYRETLKKMLHTDRPIAMDLFALRHLDSYKVLEHSPFPNQLLFQYTPIPEKQIVFKTDLPPIPLKTELESAEKEIVQLYTAMRSIHEQFYGFSSE